MRAASRRLPWREVGQESDGQNAHNAIKSPAVIQAPPCIRRRTACRQLSAGAGYGNAAPSCPAAGLRSLGCPVTRASGGSRRRLEQQSSQCARDVSEQQPSRQPEQQSWVSSGARVPHRCPPSDGAARGLLRVGSPAVPARTGLPELAADYGLPPEAKVIKMAQDHPVRTVFATRVGASRRTHIKPGRLLGSTP